MRFILQGLLVLVLMPGATAWAQKVARPPAVTEVIRTEISRLKKVLSALELPGESKQSYDTLLSRSERAAQAEQLFLSLHLLQAAAPQLTAYEHVQSQAAIVKGGAAAFQQEWRRVGAVLAARQRTVTTARRLPLAVRALLERSLTQVQPNYQASLLYGHETDTGSGLFYLAFAQAHLDFAAFCRGLNFAVPAASPLPSPAPELAAMEQAALDAYRQFDTPAQHSTFIRVNSQLKMAQDLRREQRLSGVWLQTLEARRSLAAILLTNAAPVSAAELRAQSDAARAQLTQAGGDQSLGWLYWQMAAALLEAEPAAESLKQAQAILQHVLPRYFHALTRSQL
ncbi:MAG: hypothetical protein U0Y68_09100 [Blastocatellia bacterium]